MEQRALKNKSCCQNTNISFYLDICQNSNQYLNVVHFNTGVN